MINLVSYDVRKCILEIADGKSVIIKDTVYTTRTEIIPRESTETCVDHVQSNAVIIQYKHKIKSTPIS